VALFVLLGVELYFAQREEQGVPSAQQEAVQHPLPHSAPLGKEYCKQAERLLTESLGAFPQRWSDRLTLTSVAIDGCSASFNADLALARHESAAKSAILEDARRRIDETVCEGFAARSLWDHGGAFSFRLRDSRGNSLAEFEVDGASCASARKLVRSNAPPEPCKSRIPRGYVPIRDSTSRDWFLVPWTQVHDYEVARYAYTAVEYNERMATQPCPW
jgi:hypothetical protein